MEKYAKTLTSDNLPYEKVGKNDPVCIADEIPFEIPDSWEWVRLGSIGETNIGLTYKPSDKVDEKSGTAVLRSNNIQKGKMDYTDMVYVSCNIPNRAMINKGDILICARNGSRSLVGKSAIIDVDGMAFGAFMAKYTSFLSGILNRYVLAFIESPVFRRQLDGVKTETINQITQDMIKQQIIPLPPIAEQERIIKQLTDVMPYVEQYELAYTVAEKLNSSFPELLKKSILQEAVKGKLVPQDSNDEPASVLLERIRAEKERLIREGKIKRDKHESIIFRRDNSHYEKLGDIERCIDDEIPFDIPDTWEWVRLGSIGDWKAGATPSRSVPEYYNGDIPWLKTGDLIDGFIEKIPENISKLALEKTSVKLNPAGSVLIAMYGATIGKLGILKFPATTNQACCACLPIEVYNEYLFYFLMSQKTAFVKQSEGGAQPNISKEKIIATLMPLPPLLEQKRIVVEVERLMEIVKAL